MAANIWPYANGWYCGSIEGRVGCYQGKGENLWKSGNNRHWSLCRDHRACSVLCSLMVVLWWSTSSFLGSSSCSSSPPPQTIGSIDRYWIQAIETCKFDYFRNYSPSAVCIVVVITIIFAIDRGSALLIQISHLICIFSAYSPTIASCIHRSTREIITWPEPQRQQVASAEQRRMVILCQGMRKMGIICAQ